MQPVCVSGFVCSFCSIIKCLYTFLLNCLRHVILFLHIDNSKGIDRRFWVTRSTIWKELIDRRMLSFITKCHRGCLFKYQFKSQQKVATDGCSIILCIRVFISASYMYTEGKYFKGNIVKVNIPCVHIIKVTWHWLFSDVN